MQKTITLGQVKLGPVRWLLKVIVALRPDWLGRPEFTASGLIVSLRRNRLVNAGQCLEQMRLLLPKSRLFGRVYRLWRLYHNNASRPGTAAQRLAAELYRRRKPECEYEDVCAYLKEVGLYEVKVGERTHRYGSRPLYEPIPEKDLGEMMRLLGARPAPRHIEAEGQTASPEER